MAQRESVTLESLHSGFDQNAPSDKHYLEREFYELFKQQSEAADYIRMLSLDGAWFWDLDNPEQEWMSPEFWRSLGYDPEQRAHLASEWQDLIHPDDLEVALDNFNKHCADPNHRYDQIVRYRHADGTIVHIHCRGFAVRDATGKPRRLLGCHTDVTQYIEAQNRLEQSNRNLQEFAYVAAHDLQAPVRQINLLSELLQKQLDEDGVKLSENAEVYLAHIMDASDRIRSFVRSIFQLSRVDAAPVEFSQTKLVTCVEAAERHLKDVIDIRGATIEIGDLPTLTLNAPLMTQVFQNLIENACHYNGDTPPLIRIWAEHEHPTAMHQIFITDDGIGVPEHQRENVFKPFFRANNVQDTLGHGLGLALCRRIVEAHGGSISICDHNASLNGACFCIWLPVKQRI